MEAALALPPGSMGFPGRPVSGLPVPSLSRVYFPGGLEWPSYVKEYLLFSSLGGQLLIRRFGCGLQALIGDHHT